MICRKPLFVDVGVGAVGQDRGDGDAALVLEFHHRHARMTQLKMHGEQGIGDVQQMTHESSAEPAMSEKRNAFIIGANGFICASAGNVLVTKLGKDRKSTRSELQSR